MTLTSEDQRELLERIERALRVGMPEGARGTFTWCSVGNGGSEAGFSVFDRDGKPKACSHPKDLGDLCWTLKTGMNRPGVGTWFSVRYEIDAAGEFRVDYDYDNEPPLGAGPEHFLREMAWFPRDSEHTPAWLAAILDRVPNVYFGIHAEPGNQYEDEIGPHLGEVAAAFRRAGWEVRRVEFGELTLATDWAQLKTLSHYGLIRMAGKIAPDRWNELVGLMTAESWRVGGELYAEDNETILAQITAD
ncbi:hypothetical protein [Nocardia sp. NPDC052316]|uniref:hypothetical protein n=1 Tax=Nocardia sp. NPDC052316 TaxID=3364329 RepID=UPI0037CCC0C2